MRKKTDGKGAVRAVQLRAQDAAPFGSLKQFHALGDNETAVYGALREAVPIIDAAIGKLVRLTGGFEARCDDAQAQRQLQEFLQNVSIGHGQHGIACFLSAYLQSLLTYGRAVGEMVVSGDEITAVCWGDVTKVQVQQGDSPLDFALGVYEMGQFRILPYQNLLLFSAFDPEPGHPYGVSLLRSMPFLADILLKIYKTIGENWERAGNVRYAVVYKPDGSGTDGASAAARSEQIAREWSAAMQSGKAGEVRDFVAVGDVEIKVIGADGPILDSEVAVRQILEQIVAKTGLPPFMLGLSWASTERMSKQQADILTSELWSIRRSVQPVLERVCTMWLRLHGYACTPQIEWDEISLQDTVEEAHAALYRAQVRKLDKEED